MPTFAKRLVGALAAALLLGHFTLTYAGDDHLRFVQTPTGTITAFLFGTVNPCAGSHIFPMSPSTVVRSGNEFDISSFFAILDPPPCPSPASPYEVSADLGAPPDGEYAVVWTVGPIVVRGAFKVVGGALLVLGEPIPTLDARALVALLAMVGALGLVMHRRRSRA